MRANIKYFFIALLFPAICFAGGDLYVDSDCSNGISTYDPGGDQCTGGSDYSYSTVANAIAAISDTNGGWNIILREDTYYENDLLIAASKTGASGNWNTMRSYPGEWAVIDGERSCSGNSRTLIENNDGNDCSSGSHAQYWIFERLELTGGGSTSDAVEGSALHWVQGPMIIRYCYIHDNLCGNGDENPAGISGTAWQGNTVEYNRFYNNGSDDHEQLNSCAGPSPISCSEYNSYDVNWEIRSNTIRYNYVEGSSSDVGIRTKGYTTLTATRDGSVTTRREYGDDIYHNIVIGCNNGIHYQQDGVQIHGNIINQTGQSKGTGYNSGHPIKTRRWNSTERDVLWAVIYNNLCFDAAEAISHFEEYDSGSPSASWFLVNNIFYLLTSVSEASINYGCTGGSYCPDFSTVTIPTTSIVIDRNYNYAGESNPYIYIGDQSWPTGASTYSAWESAESADLFIQSSQEGGAGKLFQGTTGADKYRTIGSHSLGEDSDTIENAGLGGSHPYLSGVTIPDYIGASDPDDDGWIAGVLAMNAAWFETQTDGSDPTWIEGAGSGSSEPTFGPGTNLSQGCNFTP